MYQKTCQISPSAVKTEFLSKHIGKFVDEFVLVEFDVERAWMEGREEGKGQKESHPPVINQMLSVLSTLPPNPGALNSQGQDSSFTVGMLNECHKIKFNH